MSVFNTEIDSIVVVEETLAVDIMCQGKVYNKVKYDLLQKVIKHP